jgi:hypothetical protein
VHFQNIKQRSFRKSSRQKIVIIFFTKSSVSRKESPHADQTRDVSWFDGRPGFADDAGAGQTSRCPEHQRTIGFIALQRQTGDGRWDMEADSLSGTGFPKTGTPQIRDAKFGRASALRNRQPVERINKEEGWAQRAAAKAAFCGPGTCVDKI